MVGFNYFALKRPSPYTSAVLIVLNKNPEVLKMYSYD